MRRRLLTGALVGAIGALALVAAGCGGGGGKKGETSTSETSTTGGASGVSAAACKPVFYQGSGKPQYIVVSDLPLQGSGRAQTVQMGAAIRFVFKQHGFKAGDYTVGYQECDDSTAQAGTYAPAKCTANAQAFASNKSVIGVVGTFNSPCAKLEVPIANRADQLGYVSPANTNVGLTHEGPGNDPGEPDKYYPTGKRNYTRIVAADDFQGAADAILAKKTFHLKKVYVLNDKESYGFGVAKYFERDAKKLGIDVAGFAAWDPKATSYEATASKIKSTGADGVFLGGLICSNGGKLIKDLRAGLGPNVQLIAPDGFTPISADVQGAGPAANGMTVSVAGLPNEKLGPAGQKFLKDFGGTQPQGQVDPYSVYAAQAAEVMLNAIAKSDGTRQSVTENLFKTDVKDGILGNFKIDENGDTNANPVTVYQIKNGQQKTLQTIVPPIGLVKG